MAILICVVLQNKRKELTPANGISPNFIREK